MSEIEDSDRSFSEENDHVAGKAAYTKKLTLSERSLETASSDVSSSITTGHGPSTAPAVFVDHCASDLQDEVVMEIDSSCREKVIRSESARVPLHLRMFKAQTFAICSCFRKFTDCLPAYRKDKND